MDNQEHIILQHDQKSLTKLPRCQEDGIMSGFDLRVLNRYLTLIKRRYSTSKAEGIIAQEFNLDESKIAEILKAPAGAEYIATTVEKLTPTKENIRYSTITSLLDMLTFNILDCYYPGTIELKPLAEMPLDAQTAIRHYGPDNFGRMRCEFYSRIDAAKLLIAMDTNGQLNALDLEQRQKNKAPGMFDRLKSAKPKTMFNRQDADD